MPTYEYNCKTCGRFDVFQKITEASLTACPTCKGDIKRVISASAVVYKASGFYTTDTRSNTTNDNNSNTNTKEDSAASSSAEKAPPSVAEPSSK